MKCYDCGSTNPGHHTALCAMTGSGDKLDLPAYGKTQWWIESTAAKLSLEQDAANLKAAGR